MKESERPRVKLTIKSERHTEAKRGDMRRIQIKRERGLCEGELKLSILPNVLCKIVKIFGS